MDSKDINKPDEPTTNVIVSEESTNFSSNSFTKLIDENSDYISKELFNKFSFNESHKEQIKELLDKELKTAINEIKSDLVKETQEIKKDFLTIFGLFASFVTFLSIEVQIFKNKDNFLELLGISSISLAFVMFFALVINDISKDKSQWSDFWKPTYILNLTFLIGGILALYFGSNSVATQINTSNQKIDKAEKEIKIIRDEVASLKKASLQRTK